MAVADIFTAMSEDRPYRKGMEKEEVYNIINNLSSKKLLDVRIVKILFDNYDEINSYVKEKQASAMEFFENQFASIDNEYKSVWKTSLKNILSYILQHATTARFFVDIFRECF